MSLDENEIKKLAEGIYKGQIFTDRHISDKGMIRAVFLPLNFLSDKIIEDMKKNPPGMIYEYMSRASHLGINGLPIFSSMKFLDVGNSKKVVDCLKKIEQAVEEVKSRD